MGKFILTLTMISSSNPLKNYDIFIISIVLNYKSLMGFNGIKPIVSYGFSRFKNYTKKCSDQLDKKSTK